MKDTFFYVPEAKQGRLATAYVWDDKVGLKPFPDAPIVEGTFSYTADYPYRGPRKLFSGGAGLLSTASDYARLCQLFLDGGKTGNMRLISRKTVELMTHDQLGPRFPGQAFGFGFGIDGVKTPLGGTGFARRVPVGRLFLYGICHRPEGGHDHRFHGPASSGRRSGTGQDFPRAGISGDRELRDARSPVHARFSLRRLRNGARCGKRGRRQRARELSHLGCAQPPRGRPRHNARSANGSPDSLRRPARHRAADPLPGLRFRRSPDSRESSGKKTTACCALCGIFPTARMAPFI